MTSKLVIVVHGVGDPNPGDALTTLVSGVCALNGAKPEGATLIRHCEDNSSPDPKFLSTFPIYQIDTLSSDQSVRTRFIEVYWGDLSRVKGTFAGLVEGLIDLVFGLRHVVFAAARELQAGTQSTFALRFLGSAIRALSMGALWLARGPLMAVNLIAAFGVLLFYLEIYALHGGNAAFREIDATYGMLATGVLAICLGVVFTTVGKRSGWSLTTAKSLIWCGLTVLAGYAVVRLRYGRSPNYEVFIEFVTAMLSIFSAIAGFAVPAMLYLSAVLLAADALGRLFTRNAQRAADALVKSRIIYRALLVMNVGAIVSMMLFVLLVMIAWALAATRIEDLPNSGRIKQSLHLFALVWLPFVCLLLVYLALVVWSWVITLMRRRRIGTGLVYPRFIVGKSAVLLILGCGLLWPMPFLPMVYDLECYGRYRGPIVDDSAFLLWRELGVCRGGEIGLFWSELIQWIEALQGPSIVLAAFVVSGLIVIRAHVGTALDIVLDVIAHFKMPETHARAKQVQIDNAHGRDSPASDTERTSEASFVPPWNFMIQRFCTVMRLAQSEQYFDEVIVVSHSQGTMIALEALGIIVVARKGPELAVSAEKVQASAPLTLVTMGCPLSYLYDHYLPLKYTAAKAPPQSVVGWINLHRVDDFVGRAVQRSESGLRPINTELGPRGHVNYWADREVLRELTGGGSCRGLL